MTEYLIAFGAGIISFLSPCVLPLIPGYVSFVSGQSLQEIIDRKRNKVSPLVLFCFGFSTVFIIFGATASVIGQIFLQNSNILRIIAGIIIIVFSLQLIGLINLKFMNYEKRFETGKSKNFFYPYLIGLAFGFGWTPCIGPILGSILTLAAIEETMFKAIFLLSLYSLGLSAPFILSGLLIQKFFIFSKKFKKNINLVSKIGGIILLFTGILILTNQLQALGFYILNTFPFLQNIG